MPGPARVTRERPHGPLSPADWEAIEPHWRAGIVSTKQLEREFGVSRQAMTKYFNRRGIGRDLTARIRGEATDLVHRAEATGGRMPPAPPAPPQGTRLSAREVVGQNAHMQAGVILNHRGVLTRAQNVTAQLLTELESQTFDAGLYRQLDHLVRQAGAIGKVAQATIAPLLEVFKRTTTTAARIENMRKLSEVLKTLVELERKVHGIADMQPADPAGDGAATEAKAAFQDLKDRFRRHLQSVPAPIPPKAA